MEKIYLGNGIYQLFFYPECEEKSFMEKSIIELPVSSCCSAGIIFERQTCARCGEPCDWVEVEYNPEWDEAEQFTLWSE